MIVKLPGWAGSLSTKLIFIIISIIIPLNIILFIATHYMNKSFERELISSYHNEVAIYMTQVDAGLSAIEQKQKELMQENWTSLHPNHNNYEIARYTVWNRLKSMRSDLALADIAYLRTNWDQVVVCTYENEKFTDVGISEVKEYLKQVDMQVYTQYQFEIIEIGNRKYLIENINLNDYTFGVLTAIDTIILGMQDMEAFSGDRIYLADMEGNIVSDSDVKSVDMQKVRQKITIDDKQEEYLVISGTSGMMDFQLVRMVKAAKINQAIPLSERILQILSAFSILLIPIMILAVRRLVLDPLKKLDYGMRQLEDKNLDYRLEEVSNSKEFGRMNRVFNQMVGQILDLKIETYEKDIQKLEIEALNLRLQINPHLLLNSLNLIYSLSQSKNFEYIQKYTLNLMEYFRYSLQETDRFVKISDEMTFVYHYLEVQKIRFPDAFISVYDIEDDLEETYIPPLMVQNFVENSIKYALRIGETIEIIIVMKYDGQDIMISICDTGNGIQKEILKKIQSGEVIEDGSNRHIGIWNCRRRLAAIYGDRAKITISSVEGEGTQIWMKFPIQRHYEMEEKDAFTNGG